MAKTEEKSFQKRRLRGSYISVIISVSLVLFTLGLLGLMMLSAQKITNEVKKNIGFTIYLQDDIKDVDVKRLRKAIEISDYSSEVIYTSKEDAVEIMKADLGEDFLDYLDHNPLLASLEVKVNSDYAHPDSLAAIQANLSRSPKIKEIDYRESLAEMIETNVRKLSIGLGVFSILFLVIAIVLINNSIRLSIYSKRFLIKSMQLVGATQSFIRRPFVRKGIIQGIYSALIATLLIMALMYYAQMVVPELINIQEVELLAYLFVIVLGLGIIISWASTSLAVRNFCACAATKFTRDEQRLRRFSSREKE